MLYPSSNKSISITKFNPKILPVPVDSIINIMLKYPDLWRGYFCDSVEQEDEDRDIVIHLEFTTLNITKNEGKARLHGEGKSEEGNFVIEGTQQNNDQFLCEYKSEKRTLFFKVTYNKSDVLQGKWGNKAEKTNSGVVAIHRIQQIQGWNGYYKQFDIPHQMKFEKFVLEKVHDGKIGGHGADSQGRFEIKGNFNEASNEVYFVKTYENGLKWDYWGILKNNQIQGEWGVKKPEK